MFSRSEDASFQYNLVKILILVKKDSTQRIKQVKIMAVKKFYTPLWPQWLAAYEVCVLSLMVGTNVGWTSPFIADLSGPNPSFETTEEQIAWVASLVNLSRTIGVIGSCIIASLGGSKITLYICGFNFAVSWVCLICANSINIVFISLVCNGISMGMLTTIFPLFISEIADPKIRGKLISVATQGSTMGSLFGSIMGAYLAPWVYAAINLIPSAVFIVGFGLLPNTPHYFMLQGKTDEATKSIQWYNRQADTSKEVENLSSFLAANPKVSFRVSLRKLCTGANLKSLVHLNIIYSVAQLTGMTTIAAYMEVLFIKAEVNVVAPSTLVILISVLTIVSCWLAVVVIGKFGRITLFFSGCVAISIALIVWGLNYHLLDLGFNEPNLQWITIISSVIWRMSIYLCIASTIPAMLGEFFAPDVKTAAVCLANIGNAVFSFLSNKFFQLMVNTMTYKYVFYLFAVMTLMLGIYSKVFIPETKGKSLAEIQEMLNKDTKTKSREESRESNKA